MGETAQEKAQNCERQRRETSQAGVRSAHCNGAGGAPRPGQPEVPIPS